VVVVQLVVAGLDCSVVPEYYHLQTLMQEMKIR
jgi:hypothetical protein